MKVSIGVSASIVALALVAVAPSQASAAKEQTCAQSYLVCLNNRPDGSWMQETLAEAECLSEYFSCLKEQAFGT